MNLSGLMFSFGHGGEVALNYMMRDNGGFEGNGQTFRILTRLEPYTLSWGMNLTRRTLLGVLKYPAIHSQLYVDQHSVPPANHRQLKPSQWTPVKSIFNDDKDNLDWVLAPLTEDDRQRFMAQAPLPNSGGYPHKKTAYKSFDCSIMELADDTAYAVHDLEDAIVMGIVTRAQWDCDVAAPLVHNPDPWVAKEFATIGNKLFSSEHHLRKDAIGTLVNGFVTAIVIEENPQFSEVLLKYNAKLEPGFATALEVLKQFVLRHVVRKPEIQMLEYKGQQVVMQLFEAFASDPERLLPLNTQSRWHQARAEGQDPMRVIADYISGMTDEFAGRLHQQLFSPRSAGMMDLGQEY